MTTRITSSTTTSSTTTSSVARKITYLELAGWGGEYGGQFGSRFEGAMTIEPDALVPGLLTVRMMQDVRIDEAMIKKFPGKAEMRCGNYGGSKPEFILRKGSTFSVHASHIYLMS